MKSVQSTRLRMLPSLATLSVLLIAAAGIALASTAAAAGNVQDGRKKAQMCIACHGADGIATMPGTPNLAGQVEMYTAMQLNAFKSGERKNAQMTVVAQSLSAKDIADLSAYYAAIEVTVGKVPGQ
jgi:cytochrome c553